MDRTRMPPLLIIPRGRRAGTARVRVSMTRASVSLSTLNVQRSTLTGRCLARTYSPRRMCSQEKATAQLNRIIHSSRERSSPAQQTTCRQWFARLACGSCVRRSVAATQTLIAHSILRVMEGGRPYGSTATTLATHVRPRQAVDRRIRVVQSMYASIWTST